MITEKIFLGITKEYLSTDKTLEQLSIEFNCSPTTISSRYMKTILRLVKYYDFDSKGIDYPYIKEKYNYGRWRFSNARDFSSYWLKVISNYENKIIDYHPPKKEGSTLFKKFPENEPSFNDNNLLVIVKVGSKYSYAFRYYDGEKFEEDRKGEVVIAFTETEPSSIVPFIS